jgi:hypothetical protein
MSSFRPVLDQHPDSPMLEQDVQVVDELLGRTAGEYPTTSRILSVGSTFDLDPGTIPSQGMLVHLSAGYAILTVRASGGCQHRLVRPGFVAAIPPSAEWSWYNLTTTVVLKHTWSHPCLFPSLMNAWFKNDTYLLPKRVRERVREREAHHLAARGMAALCALHDDDHMSKLSESDHLGFEKSAELTRFSVQPHMNGATY